MLNMSASSRTLIGATALVVLIASPVRADDDAKKALIAAAAIAGVVALAHHNKNHSDGNHYSDSNREAQYDRGYQDGLHAADFNDHSDSQDYADGFNAGNHDRLVRNSHNASNQWEQGRHGAPDMARRACVGEASSAWDINPRDITPTSSKDLGNGRYEVIVSAGYHRSVCTANRDGEVSALRDLETNTSWAHNAPHGRDEMAYSTRDYDATAQLACSMNTADLNRLCDAGIDRSGSDSALIRVKGPAGRERVFEIGGGEVRSPDGDRLDWSHSSDEDTWNIGIQGREFYEIPDALVYGD